MDVTVRVRVPGTTANCGPGFDAVGIACSIYNDMELTLAESGELRINAYGEGCGAIPEDERNIVFQAVRKVMERINVDYKGILITLHNRIPLARGLGSSAAAIVAGLIAANEALGRKLSKEDLLNMATELEGHPDNVAPAIYGGVCLSVMEQEKTKTLRFLPDQRLTMVVAVPDFTLSTKVSRHVLPKTVSIQDAVFNISRASLFVGSLACNDLSFLKYALEDRLHQPYREKLIPGMKQVLQAAKDKGALGGAISGAGPTLIAFTCDNQEEVGQAMVNGFQRHGVNAHYQVLKVDTEGAKVL